MRRVFVYFFLLIPCLQRIIQAAQVIFKHWPIRLLSVFCASRPTQQRRWGITLSIPDQFQWRAQHV